MSLDGKFKLDLEKRTDTYGNVYYIGRVKAPISINCQDGTAFLIFISEEGNEQMQISSFEAKEKKMPQVYKETK